MTNHHMKTYLENTIEYIEVNLEKHLTADELAGAVNLSKYHLQRVFKSVCGIGLMAYVRQRKLTESLIYLKTRQLSIIDLAMQLGYDYEQSFTRAFKKNFGLTPSQYRQKNIALKIRPKLDLSFVVDLEDAVIIKPEHVMMPPMQVAGLRCEISQDEKYRGKASEKGVDFFFNQRMRIKNPVNENIYIGYTTAVLNRPEMTQYLTGIPVDEKSVLPEDFVVDQIPSGEYIIFKIIGNFPARELTWRHLQEIWHYRDCYLKGQGAKQQKYGYFEYVDFSKCDEHYCELSLYIPKP